MLRLTRLSANVARYPMRQVLKSIGLLLLLLIALFFLNSSVGKQFVYFAF